MTVIHARTALLPSGWAQDVAVQVARGRIVSVTTGVAVGVDGVAPVACLIPAPVNLHSHTFQRAMAGLTERRSAGQDSFWTWRTLMYRFLERLAPEDVEAIAAMAMVEMAEEGFAAVAEFHYLHHAPGGGTYAHLAEMSGRIGAAAQATGLGLTLLPVLYERGGCDGRPLAAGQLRFGNDPERFLQLVGAVTALAPDLAPDTVVGIAPHSLRAVSAEGLRAVLEARPAGPVHIHVAEQVAEVGEVLAHTGARPVEWLLANAPVDGRWCTIHATQMQPQETLALARSGAVAGLCPITEANLGDGIFDGVRYRAAHGRFGVGTDSNVRISLSEELRMLEYSQRLGLKGRALMAEEGQSCGRVLLEAATAGGAQAAGRAAGRIEAGLWADLLALDCSGPDMAASVGDMALDTWMFARGGVADLWSAGRHIVTGGQHLARDAVRARYGAAIGRLRAEL